MDTQNEDVTPQLLSTSACLDTNRASSYDALTMRPEITHWWEQAEEDLDTARYNAAGGKLYAAAFFCHQAVEKALKALLMLRMRASPPRTHSLFVLARQAGAPKEFYRFLKELTAEYIVSRYPNATDEVPAKLYDLETVHDYIARSTEVLQWIERQMKAT